ncbi:non-heme iron oxygenase ferredoxin subunit [Oceanibacterium hippocampi]|uniref:Naphthalene 1,2-dioxygenase system ferredoxin subunit n=1 Tax=Oceanibacterium hippocampi TaxID=745714 RepID=A0A1Y5RAK3_9PROT|nr:Naphthalene 1,2-dioxygenase system ferredoxin subunit [Oceanibacterium hippocampi]
MPWCKIGTKSDLSDGEVMGVEVEGVPLAVYNVDGEFFATHNICTHAFALLSDGYVEDGKIECPLHQGIFDIRTGKAESGPVEDDVRTFTVRIEGDDLLVEI